MLFFCLRGLTEGPRLFIEVFVFRGLTEAAPFVYCGFYFSRIWAQSLLVYWSLLSPWVNNRSRLFFELFSLHELFVLWTFYILRVVICCYILVTLLPIDGSVFLVFTWVAYSICFLVYGSTRLFSLISPFPSSSQWWRMEEWLTLSRKGEGEGEGGGRKGNPPPLFPFLPIPYPLPPTPPSPYGALGPPFPWGLHLSFEPFLGGGDCRIALGIPLFSLSCFFFTVSKLIFPLSGSGGLKFLFSTCFLCSFIHKATEHLKSVFSDPFLRPRLWEVDKNLRKSLVLQSVPCPVPPPWPVSDAVGLAITLTAVGFRPYARRSATTSASQFR